jgi:FtsZ-interacting cell division protein YlmF
MYSSPYSIIPINDYEETRQSYDNYQQGREERPEMHEKHRRQSFKSFLPCGVGATRNSWKFKLPEYRKHKRALGKEHF